LVLNTACNLLGCTVVQGLEDPAAQLFLVTIPDILPGQVFMNLLSAVLGILHVEPDTVVQLQQSPPPVPPALTDPDIVSYFGADVNEGYLTQPAAQILRLQEAQTTFNATGATIVAVIDTGVDPDHPVLRNVLLPGYDFTRNRVGCSEEDDITEPVQPVVQGVPPLFVNGSTVVIVNQSTAAVVDNPDYAAFGHGTMVSGVIHLVAPTAAILPLKAFGANGLGYTSNILRALYRAVFNSSRVINMSFSMPHTSTELKRAVDYATGRGVICVASAGNDGQATTVYPAAWNKVMGVASTTNEDTRSSFSNYGSTLVWVAAPGEGIVTTYPFATYAAAWGTSFSAPFVSGTTALLLQVRGNLNYSSAAAAIAEAEPLGPELGQGRLDIYRAIQAVQ
jgi:thermitase